MMLHSEPFMIRPSSRWRVLQKNRAEISIRMPKQLPSTILWKFFADLLLAVESDTSWKLEGTGTSQNFRGWKFSSVFYFKKVTAAYPGRTAQCADFCSWELGGQLYQCTSVPKTGLIGPGNVFTCPPLCTMEIFSWLGSFDGTAKSNRTDPSHSPILSLHQHRSLLVNGNSNCTTCTPCHWA